MVHILRRIKPCLSVIVCVRYVRKRGFHKATLRRRLGCFVVTCLVSKTVTQFRLSRRLRNLLVPLKFRCTNFFMTAKSLRSCRISPSVNPPTMLPGAARTKMHTCLPSSAGCSAAWKKVIWEWCCLWPRRWRSVRLFNPTGRYVGKNSAGREILSFYLVLVHSAAEECVAPLVSHSWLNDLVTHRVANQLNHVMHFQLAHDIGAMGFDGFGADTQGGSDFIAPHALSKQLHNFAFA